MSKTSNAQTVVDGLKDVYTQVASLKLSPDAGQHMDVLNKLSDAILGLIQQITQQKAQQAAQMQQMVAQQAIGGQGQPGQPQGQPGQGGPAGMPPGGPPKGQPGGPPSQGSPGIAVPNPDELRRVLMQQGAGG